ncbi:MAG: hypothetical protein AAF399_24205 [Bacteroidota bacterium]
MELTEKLLRRLDYRLAIIALWFGLVVLFSAGLFQQLQPELEVPIQLLRWTYFFCQVILWAGIWKAICVTESRLNVWPFFGLILLSILFLGIRIGSSTDFWLSLISGCLFSLAMIGIWHRTDRLLGLRHGFFLGWFSWQMITLLLHLNEHAFTLHTGVSNLLFGLLFIANLGAYICTTIVLIRAHRSRKSLPPTTESLIDEIGIDAPDS